jgi:membrane protease subunit (stomatin/prohibitin family)
VVVAIHALRAANEGALLGRSRKRYGGQERYDRRRAWFDEHRARFVDALGNAKIPMLDLAGNYDKVSKIALEKISPELAKMGVTLTQFFVENISLPPEVEAALDKRAQMSVLGNLDQYTKLQTADAIRGTIEVARVEILCP